jgi:Skp family chaperone for outer membrane proteins
MPEYRYHRERALSIRSFTYDYNPEYVNGAHGGVSPRTSVGRAAPALKLGAVDLQRAVKECKEGVATRADLQRKVELFNAEIKVLQVDFQSLSAELDKEGAKLSVDQGTEKER